MYGSYLRERKKTALREQSMDNQMWVSSAGDLAKHYELKQKQITFYNKPNKEQRAENFGDACAES